jgi:prepilin-type N-terminal cleavage/methylation domain-containing protein
LRLKRKKLNNAFTLIELLVVISVCALLLSILVPTLSKVKRAARSLISANNQKQITNSVLCYSSDANGRYPDSVAKVGKSTRWNWRQPQTLAGYKKTTPATYRSVSEFLRPYLESSSTMSCPSAPSKYPYAEEAWQAGDSWDNPDTTVAAEDPLYGTYCLYWNYVGYLVETGKPFIGPRSVGQKRTESKLLVSDYFGYGHWRNELVYSTRNAFGSCEKFTGASVTPGTDVSCNFWSRDNTAADISIDSIDVKFYAGYTDGHVEKFTSREVTPMKISIKPDGTKPYPDNISPGGTYYIPK